MDLLRFKNVSVKDRDQFLCKPHCKNGGLVLFSTEEHDKLDYLRQDWQDTELINQELSWEQAESVLRELEKVQVVVDDPSDSREAEGYPQGREGSDGGTEGAGKEEERAREDVILPPTMMKTITGKTESMLLAPKRKPPSMTLKRFLFRLAALGKALWNLASVYRGQIVIHSPQLIENLRFLRECPATTSAATPGILSLSDSRRALSEDIEHGAAAKTSESQGSVIERTLKFLSSHFVGKREFALGFNFGRRTIYEVKRNLHFVKQTFGGDGDSAGRWGELIDLPMGEEEDKVARQILGSARLAIDPPNPPVMLEEMLVTVLDQTRFPGLVALKFERDSVGLRHLGNYFEARDATNFSGHVWSGVRNEEWGKILARTTQWVVKVLKRELEYHDAYLEFYGNWSIMWPAPTGSAGTAGSPASGGGSSGSSLVARLMRSLRTGNGAGGAEMNSAETVFLGMEVREELRGREDETLTTLQVLFCTFVSWLWEKRVLVLQRVYGFGQHDHFTEDAGVGIEQHPRTGDDLDRCSLLRASDMISDDVENDVSELLKLLGDAWTKASVLNIKNDTPGVSPSSSHGTLHAVQWIDVLQRRGKLAEIMCNRVVTELSMYMVDTVRETESRRFPRLFQTTEGARQLLLRQEDLYKNKVFGAAVFVKAGGRAMFTPSPKEIGLRGRGSGKKSVAKKITKIVL